LRGLFDIWFNTPLGRAGKPDVFLSYNQLLDLMIYMVDARRDPCRLGRQVKEFFG